MFSYNEDFASSAGDPVSLEPRVGYLQSSAIAFNASFNSQEFVGNVNAYDDYEKQNTSLVDKGITMPSTFSKDGQPINPSDIGRHYEGQETNVSPEALKAYDDKIESARKQYPDLKLRTTKEIWDDAKKVQQEYQAMEDQRRGTTLGKVGGVVGHIAGTMGNPSNIAASLVGGELFVGAKAGLGAKLAAEGAAQGGATAVNEATGDASYRKALGMDGSFQSSLENIIGAGAGGVVLKGAAHGLGVAGKRWFADAPNDPAPAVPKDFGTTTKPSQIDIPLTPEQHYALQKALPTSIDPALTSSRLGTARLLDDINHVQSRLEAWDGESPVNLRPQTDTSIPLEPASGVRFDGSYSTRAALNQLTPDELARRIDPDTFRVYDAAAAKLDLMRGEMASIKADVAGRNAQIAPQLKELDTQIAALQAKFEHPNTSAKNRKLISQKLEPLEQQHAELKGQLLSGDTPREAVLRQSMTAMDTRMRDLAPVVSRAYERARGEFGPSPELKNAVESMVREGRPTLKPQEVDAIINKAREMHEAPAATGLQPSPIEARLAPEDIHPDKPIAHGLAKVAERDSRAATEQLDAFRASLTSLLKEENTSVTIGEHTFNLKDKLEVPNADGTGSREITVKQMLDELHEADYDLKAMKTCSI